MKHLKTGIATIVLILSINFYSSAQEANSKTKISIEIDPATFAFKGYSFHLRLQPKDCEHLLFGFGTYAMDMPDLLVDFNSKNKNKGWDVRLNQGYSLFGEHHFSKVNHKWFIGSQIGVQEFKIQNSHVNGKEKFTNILAMAYFGYTIKPFKNNLYIKPWAGAGYTSKISGNNTLGASEYDIAPITMFATLHIGYAF
ncbi:hypothetical protein [Flavivirga algicola]|uniref:DUF3575 domain-containing protein n=1 Tax=Flavivirga algicola TaxID=2729136 RepID=A0ABX1RRV9_9FLAO|nr:hypothetical protein [Flavivirga algicola]NMH86291.1 hypothetical protein [Flavivirga algicola]